MLVPAILGRQAAYQPKWFWADRMDPTPLTRSMMSSTNHALIRYDDAIFCLTTQWSNHLTKPLTEIEVFAGFILNKKGFQGIANGIQCADDLV